MAFKFLVGQVVLRYRSKQSNIAYLRFNTYMVKVLGTPIGGQGGVPMDPNSENAFPEGIF